MASIQEAHPEQGLAKGTNWWGAFVIGLAGTILVTGIAPYAVQGTGALAIILMGVMTIATLLLFVGATGKSAQLPLHVWLPDAMEGPTPVSALIHAATMVTAGVYMIGRNAVLFSHAPMTLEIVAGIGVATALMAGTIGLVQNDIKRVLAYSTVSQLGFMVTALGVGDALQDGRGQPEAPEPAAGAAPARQAAGQPRDRERHGEGHDRRRGRDGEDRSDAGPSDRQAEPEPH